MLAQYGSQTVPITDDLERLLAFKPAKGMQLLGFVTNDPAAPLVPRHTFMSVRCRRGCQKQYTCAEASRSRTAAAAPAPCHRACAGGVAMCVCPSAHAQDTTVMLKSSCDAARRTSGSWRLTRRTSGRGLPWQRWSQP